VSFDFDSEWTPTALTPETVPARWMLLATAFETFDREVGAHCAAIDLQRALAAGWIKRSMALRDVGTPERPIWQQRELPNDFWRLLAFYAKVDHDGKAAIEHGSLATSNATRIRRPYSRICTSRCRAPASTPSRPSDRRGDRWRGACGASWDSPAGASMRVRRVRGRVCDPRHPGDVPGLARRLRRRGNFQKPRPVLKNATAALEHQAVRAEAHAAPRGR
jgi:hypothetical protein